MPTLTPDLRRALARSGYYPELVADVLATALADEPVEAHLVRLETTFDAEIRRHVTALALTATRLVLVHVDDLPPEGDRPASASATSEVVSLKRVRTVGLTRVVADPARHRTGEVPGQRVRPAMHQLIASMVVHPAFIVGRRTDVLASNLLARTLVTDWPRLPPRERNYTRWVLLDPAAREVYTDWATVAADVVGTLRLYAGRFPDDPQLNELVGELTIKSPQFRTWWDNHRVHERTHGTKHMIHPAVGPITIRYEALTLPGDDDQTLFVYNTDPGSSSHDNMRLLALWATQNTAEATRTTVT